MKYSRLGQTQKLIQNMIKGGANVNVDEIMGQRFYAFPKGNNLRNTHRNGAKTATEAINESGKILHISPIKTFGPNGEELPLYGAASMLEGYEELNNTDEEDVPTMMKIGLKSLQKFEK